MPSNLPAYRAIKAEAQDLCWPTTYKTDVTCHDYDILRRKTAPASFVWILRDCGTLFHRTGSPTELMWAKAEACSSYRNGAWYIWDGDELLAVRPDPAVSYLARSIIGLPVYETMYGYAVPDKQIATVSNIVVGLPQFPIRILVSNEWVDLNTEFGLIVL